MAGVDKLTRVLQMYSKLLEGGKIYKEAFCSEARIDQRTFERDIGSIRLFLSESYSGHELVYDRKDESYHLDNSHRQRALSGMEMGFLLELLKANPGLRKDEYVGLVQSILDAGESGHKSVAEKIAERTVLAYPNESEKTALLKLQWDLQQCIAACDRIRLCFTDKSRICFSPVALWIQDQAFYVFGYDMEEELIAVPVYQIESFRMERKKFDKTLIERFDALSRSEKQEVLKKKEEDIHEEKNLNSIGDGGGKAGKDPKKIPGIV